MLRVRGPNSTSSGPSHVWSARGDGLTPGMQISGKRQIGRPVPPVPERAAASVKTDVAEIKESAHR